MKSIVFRGASISITHIITYTIIQPVVEKNSLDSIVDSLVGAIPNTGKSLSEYRSERLQKYTSIN